MKKNSFNTAAAVLLVAGLTVFGVTSPAYAETDPTVTPETPVVVDDTAVDPTAGAPEAEVPVEVETPVEETAPLPTEETGPTDETPVDPIEEVDPTEEEPEVPVVDAPATPTAKAANVGITTAEITITAPVDGGAVTGYVVNVYNDDRTVELSKAVATPSIVKFDGLVGNTKFNFEVVATGPGGSTFYSNTFVTAPEPETEPIAVPAPTKLSVKVTANGAIVNISSDGVRGPVDHYSVTINADGDSVGVTKTTDKAGNLEFSGLDAGLYSVRGESFGPGGSTAVAGFYFMVSDAPNTPSVSTLDVGVDYIIGEIKPNLTNPIPATDGPNALAPVTYTVTLTGGATTQVFETTEANPAKNGRFYFGNLDASKSYTVSVVAANVAGASKAGVLDVLTKAVEAPAAPVAPNPDTLVDGTRGGLEVPATATVGDTITVQLDSSLAGLTVHGWLFSVPTDLGTAVVNADGTARFAIPTSVPAGAHRLAVMSENNVLIGWGNIQVAVPDNGTAPVVTPPAVITPADNGAGVVTVGNNAAANSGANAVQANSTGRLANTGNDPSGLILLSALLLGAGVLLITRRKAAHQA